MGNWESFQKSSCVGFSLKKVRILSKRGRFGNKNGLPVLVRDRIFVFGGILIFYHRQLNGSTKVLRFLSIALLLKKTGAYSIFSIHFLAKRFLSIPLGIVF